MIRNAFTVDVEDYFQVSAFANTISPRQWPDYESRVVNNTHRILRILEDCQIRGTFFILGWVAENYPQLVCDIKKAGHEIGSHSYWHRLIYNLTPEEFRDDLRRSNHAIENIIGQKVTAYRAPSFSITRSSLWALEILADEGMKLDSSIFPAVHDRYGIPGAERHIHQIETKCGTLSQFPPSVFSLSKLCIPVGGGGYFRLYPLSATEFCIRRVNRRDCQPFMFYVHPWEVDPQQPRIVASRMKRFRHYVNLAQTETKLRRMISNFSFGSASDVLAEHLVRCGDKRPKKLCCDDSGLTLMPSLPSSKSLEANSDLTQDNPFEKHLVRN